MSGFAKTHRRIASLALAAFVSAIAGMVLLSSPAFAKKYHSQVHGYECRTGWWSVRDGHRYWRPSDGMWRPSWGTRCFRTVVRRSR